ncbi:MAG: T9SS type A sorting domain-containing protein [Chitinophagaceae bacterium]|nr:T9SS type A sorting domain-containing protein [Chitinophagaceae bacterium]
MQEEYCTPTVQKNFNGNIIKLDVSKYSAGAYFIKVTNKDLSEVIRIIKR